MHYLKSNRQSHSGADPDSNLPNIFNGMNVCISANTFTGTAFCRFISSALWILFCLFLLAGCNSVAAGTPSGHETISSTAETKGSSSAKDSSKKSEKSSAKDSNKKSEKGSAKAGSSAPASQDSASATQESVSAPRTLKYIDAWKEWHTMEVDPAVDENIYDAGKWVKRNGQITLDDKRYKVLQGIDVSEHQGSIDWNAVAQAGIDFAFIRVGYRGYGEAGNLYEDATAVENLRSAKAAGLQVGTYIFSQALNKKEAREEADLAVRVIKKSKVETDLPLMYDPELIKDDWGRANDITRKQVRKNTAAFKDQVESTSELKVDIYSNLPWEHNYFDAKTMNQFGIWYADYEKIPQTPYHFVWWQYTNEGTVPGIDGSVDRNLWIQPKDATAEK